MRGDGGRSVRDELNEKADVFETGPVKFWQVTDQWIVVKDPYGDVLGGSIQVPTDRVTAISWLQQVEQSACTRPESR